MADAFDLSIQAALRAPSNANINRFISDTNAKLRRGVNVPVTIGGQAAALQGLNKVKSAIDKTQKSAVGLGDSIGLAAKRFTAFTLASGIIIKLASDIRNATREAFALDVEITKLAQVMKVSVGQAGRSLIPVITDISKEFGVSTTKIAQTVRLLKQSGIAINEVKIAARTLAQTDLLATFDSISQTTEGLIAVMQQFEFTANRASKALGSINAVSKAYAVESADLIQAVRKTGGVFAATGGSVEELLGLFTSVRSTTREASEVIATGLRTIFSRLQRQKTIDFFSTKGIELIQDGRFIGNLKAIEAINKGIAKSTNLQVGTTGFAELLEQIGGVRQIKVAIPLLTQFSKAQDAVGIAIKGQDSISEDAEKGLESFSRRIELVKQNLNALFVEITQSDGFRSLLNLILSTSNALVELARSLKSIAPILATIGLAKLGLAIGGGFTRITPFASGGKTKEGLAYLHDNEAVINPKQQRKIGQLTGIRASSLFKAAGVPGYAHGRAGDFSERLSRHRLGKLGSFTTQSQPSLNTTNALEPLITDLEGVRKETQRLVDSLGGMRDAISGVSEISEETQQQAKKNIGTGVKGSFNRRTRRIGADLSSGPVSARVIEHEVLHSLDLKAGGGQAFASEIVGTIQNDFVNAIRPVIEKEVLEQSKRLPESKREAFVKNRTSNREIFVAGAQRQSLENKRRLLRPQIADTITEDEILKTINRGNAAQFGAPSIGGVRLHSNANISRSLNRSRGAGSSFQQRDVLGSLSGGRFIGGSGGRIGGGFSGSGGRGGRDSSGVGPPGDPNEIKARKGEIDAIDKTSQGLSRFNDAITTGGAALFVLVQSGVLEDIQDILGQFADDVKDSVPILSRFASQITSVVPKFAAIGFAIKALLTSIAATTAANTAAAAASSAAATADLAEAAASTTAATADTAEAGSSFFASLGGLFKGFFSSIGPLIKRGLVAALAGLATSLAFDFGKDIFFGITEKRNRFEEAGRGTNKQDFIAAAEALARANAESESSSLKTLKGVAVGAIAGGVAGAKLGPKGLIGGAIIGGGVGAFTAKTGIEDDIGDRATRAGVSAGRLFDIQKRAVEESRRIEETASIPEDNIRTGRILQNFERSRRDVISLGGELSSLRVRSAKKEFVDPSILKATEDAKKAAESIETENLKAVEEEALRLSKSLATNNTSIKDFDSLMKSSNKEQKQAIKNAIDNNAELRNQIDNNIKVSIATRQLIKNQTIFTATLVKSSNDVAKTLSSFKNNLSFVNLSLAQAQGDLFSRDASLDSIINPKNVDQFQSELTKAGQILGGSFVGIASDIIRISPGLNRILTSLPSDLKKLSGESTDIAKDRKNLTRTRQRDITSLLRGTSFEGLTESLNEQLEAILLSPDKDSAKKLQDFIKLIESLVGKTLPEFRNANEQNSRKLKEYNTLLQKRNQQELKILTQNIKLGQSIFNQANEITKLRGGQVGVQELSGQGAGVVGGITKGLGVTNLVKDFVQAGRSADVFRKILAGTIPSTAEQDKLSQKEQKEKLLRLAIDETIKSIDNQINATKELISQEKAATESRRGFAKQFAFGTNEQRLEQVNTIRAARFAANQGSLAGIPEKFRSGIGSLLSQFSDVKLNAFGGRTGKQVEGQLLADTLLRAGLVNLAEAAELRKGVSSKENKLIDDLSGLFKERNVFEAAIISREEVANKVFSASVDRFKQSVDNVFGNNVIAPVGKASGGMINFSPMGTDTVPAMLTPGEFVMKKSAVKSIGVNNLSAMNNGITPEGFAKGGLVNTLPQNALKNLSDKEQLQANQIYGKLVDFLTFDNSISKTTGLPILNNFGGANAGNIRAIRNFPKDPRVKKFTEELRSIAGVTKPFYEVNNITSALNKSTNGRFSTDMNKLISSLSVYVKSTQDENNIQKLSPEKRRSIKRTQSLSLVARQKFGKGFSELTEGQAKVVENSIANRNDQLRNITTPISSAIRKAGDDVAEITKERLAQERIEFFGDGLSKRQQASRDQIRSVLGNSEGQLIKRRGRTTRAIFGFNQGGPVPGPTDTVPAMLTPGEFVLRKQAVQNIGVGNLNRMNAQGYARGGKVQRYQNGGSVISNNTPNPSLLVNADTLIASLDKLTGPIPSMDNLSTAINNLIGFEFKMTLAPTSVSVNLNGLEILSSITPQIQKMVMEQVGQAIKTERMKLEMGSR